MPIDFHAAANRRTYSGRDADVSWREAVAALVDPVSADVVDVGCGGGTYTRAWHELGAATVTGVDFSGPILDAAREGHGRPAGSRLPPRRGGGHGPARRLRRRRVPACADPPSGQTRSATRSEPVASAAPTELDPAQGRNKDGGARVRRSARGAAVPDQWSNWPTSCPCHLSAGDSHRPPLCRALYRSGCRSLPIPSAAAGPAAGGAGPAGRGRSRRGAGPSAGRPPPGSRRWPAASVPIGEPRATRWPAPTEGSTGSYVVRRPPAWSMLTTGRPATMPGEHDHPVAGGEHRRDRARPARSTPRWPAAYGCGGGLERAGRPAARRRAGRVHDARRRRRGGSAAGRRPATATGPRRGRSAAGAAGGGLACGRPSGRAAPADGGPADLWTSRNAGETAARTSRMLSGAARSDGSTSRVLLPPVQAGQSPPRSQRATAGGVAPLDARAVHHPVPAATEKRGPPAARRAERLQWQSSA